MKSPAQNAMANGLGMGLPKSDFGLPFKPQQPQGGPQMFPQQPYKPPMPPQGGPDGLMDPFDPIAPSYGANTPQPFGQRPMQTGMSMGWGQGVKNRLAMPY